MNCREATLLILDCVDYTAGACSPFEMVAAVLPKQVLDKARAAYDKEEEGPHRKALMSLIGRLDYIGYHTCSATSFVGACIDEYTLKMAREGVQA